jgi:hypothetical protein
MPQFYTKGPWEAIYWKSGKGIHIMSKDLLAGHVCSIHKKENAMFRDDGYFIAAAPEMYEELQALHTEFQSLLEIARKTGKSIEVKASALEKLVAEIEEVLLLPERKKTEDK